MECPKCKTSLLLDHQDDRGRYFYVCINKRCTEYMKAHNITSGEVTQPKIISEKE